MSGDYTGWTIIEDSEDGSLLVQAPNGERRRIWQGCDEKANKEIERLREENARLREQLADNRCAKCCGTGSLHRAWNDDYIDCDACDGRGH